MSYKLWLDFSFCQNSEKDECALDIIYEVSGTAKFRWYITRRRPAADPNSERLRAVPFVMSCCVAYKYTNLSRSTLYVWLANDLTSRLPRDRDREGVLSGHTKFYLMAREVSGQWGGCLSLRIHRQNSFTKRLYVDPSSLFDIFLNFFTSDSSCTFHLKLFLLSN